MRKTEQINALDLLAVMLFTQACQLAQAAELQCQAITI
jgi:hypothetical protein